MRFEYHAITIMIGCDEEVPMMNIAGLLGWELIGMMPDPLRECGGRFFFKRRIQGGA